MRDKEEWPESRIEACRRALVARGGQWDVREDKPPLRSMPGVEVWLDGQPVTAVRAFNLEEGWVCRLKRPGSDAEEILHGRVEIRWPESTVVALRCWLHRWGRWGEPFQVGGGLSPLTLRQQRRCARCGVTQQREAGLPQRQRA